MKRFFTRQATFTASLMLLALSLLTTAAAADTLDASKRFTVSREGAGDPVFFIPGLTSSPSAFKAALSEPLGVEAHWITLAGFAGVDAPPTTDNFVGDAASSLVAFIESQDLKNVRLVGHSMGGVVSLMIASRLPERVSAVLIVDSVPFLPALFQPGITEELAAMQANGMKAQFDSMSHAQFLTMMGQGLPRQATSPDSQALVFDDIKASDQRSVAAATAELFGTNYSHLLDTVRAPVTVLVPHNAFVGMTSEQLLSVYRGMYEGLSNVDFTVVENSRHFVMLDQPEAFDAALTNFLEGAQ
ncbi:MAG: alpha/beta hydrolase [Pseudomonadota bacterium]